MIRVGAPVDPATDPLPQSGRVRCKVCLRHYQHGHGEGRTARHLASKVHIAAAEQLGIDPGVEHAERARCAICGGVANVLRRHTVTDMHRRAAQEQGLDPRLVDLPDTPRR